MKGVFILFFLLIVVSMLFLGWNMQQDKELEYQRKEIKELQRQYNTLYDTQRYLLFQIEDLKQF